MTEISVRAPLLREIDRHLKTAQKAGPLVGGEMLATAIKSTRNWGVVTCCGLVGSPELPVNVFPFILRGVRLIGIDSAECPAAPRVKVWQKLATEWRLDNLASMVDEVTLDGLEDKIQKMLKGGLKRRALVNLLES